MNYQVWTKDEYGETYTKVDCGDIDAVERELQKAFKKGQEPLVTVEVPYKVNIKLGEVGSEIKKDKAKPGEGPGAEGDGKVRPGDEGAAEKLDKGSGDPGTSPGAGD